MLSASEAYDRVAPVYDCTFHRPLDAGEDALTFGPLAWTDGLNVLDLGCGTGLYLEKRKPGDYTGIDISGNMVALACRKFPGKRFYKRDMIFINGLAEKPFDAVISTFAALSYCVRPTEAVARIYSVLKPGGRFSLQVLGERYRWRKSHIVGGLIKCNYFTAPSLKALFGAFENVQVQGLNLFGDTLAPVLGPKISAYLHWEYKTLGRLLPSACYLLTVTGNRPEVVQHA